MRLGEGEPAAGPWRVEPVAAFAARLLAAAGRPVGRPPIVAVDGRSSSGKTSLAARLEAAVPGAATVHTDDVAWWQSMFDWAGLLAEGVLEPVRRGGSAAYRPPAWDERGRTGAITVPAGAALMIVEGVGAGRRELAALLDAVVYVQCDLDERDRRDAVRVAAGEITPADHAAWMAEEHPFVAAQCPWERAFAIVAGTPPLPHDPSTDLVVAPPPGSEGP